MKTFARPVRMIAALTILTALALGAAWIWRADGAEPSKTGDDAIAAAGFDANETAAIEALVRNYILEHPEILPEAIERLRAKEAAERVAAMGRELHLAYPGAVLGNPEGKTVMIEFADYACGYCRQAVEHVNTLIAENPDLKVVMRELPILSDGSVEAAKVALAAAQQGKYEAFHQAMYEVGRPTDANIAAAARKAGVDMAQARAAIKADKGIAAEIERNRAMAQQLGISGTPSWVIGTQLMQGAVGEETLREALPPKDS